MIVANNLTKKYGQHTAIDNLNFTIPSGSVTAFLGPNGAGKSTTMNIMTGYLAATSGQLLIDGRDIADEAQLVKQGIGYLGEQPPLYDDFTVSEYLAFVAGLKKVDTKQATIERERIYELVGIGHVKGRLIKNLSKGYKQRVGLAQALIGNPPLLILDEPTVGLDPEQMVEVRGLITTLAKEHTIVLSSHILSEVQAVCQQALIISKGKIVANDTTANLAGKLADSNKLIIRIKKSDAVGLSAALTAINKITKVTEVESDETGTADFELTARGESDIRAEVAKAVVASGADLLAMRRQADNLEEIFLSLTK
ncbi:MAG: ABC transporter ATP-binding protein [Spirochaetaceae bacterium]|nr:ABC transporter ATP-binding protein [Spirochaetaceae bacterium]